VERIVECVPNFSEGRRTEVISAIVNAIQGSPGVRLLDYSANVDHNRLVVTFVGTPETCAEAAFAGAAVATDLINMEEHHGEHPRIGSTDVIPFVPVQGVSLDECVEVARGLGERIAGELGIPVYLYEAAATRPERRNLADVRRGQYEALKEEITRLQRNPDFGPCRLHPTAGATIVGAREPLIAFNVNLGTSDVEVAKEIAKAVRGSSGGFVNVKALGVMLKERGLAQVSMNMVNYAGTPLHRAYELVKLEAGRYGVPVVGSEVVGLVPMQALLDAAGHYLQLEKFGREQVLEVRVWER
jgi:glutamate formiminotransferase